MPGRSLPRAQASVAVRRLLCQLSVVILASVTLVLSQSAAAQKPSNPSVAPKTAVTKSADDKPQTKPDESASAAATLVQLNNALEGLAAKVSPGVVLPA
jgi:hypothetical protein